MAFISQEFTESDKAISEIIRKTALNPLNSARLIENITVSSSADTIVNHGLGKVPVGYIIIKKTTICDVYHTGLNTLTLSIRGSTSAILSMLVF